jgi:hypothetical protein
MCTVTLVSFKNFALPCSRVKAGAGAAGAAGAASKVLPGAGAA